MPTKQQLYQTWATEFEFPSTRREDAPLYRKPNKTPPMTPTISKELQEQIEREAEGYSREQEADYSRRSVNAYIAGAAAYAHYKERWEQAIKALERIANLSIPEAIINVQDKLLVLQAIANEALASWKEEGKEGGE